MITLHNSAGRLPLSAGDGAPQTLPADTVWIDLYNATTEEGALVEHLTGMRLPSEERLTEVETSSRQSIDGDALVMSTPVIYRAEGGVFTTPVGFVLNRKLLVTLRQEKLKAFGDLLSRVESHEVGPLAESADAFLGLLDAIVDRMADGMESVGADLSGVSKDIFNIRSDGALVKPNKIEQRLQDILQLIGRSGDTTAQVRDSLLGLSRMIAYVNANAERHLSPEIGRRLETIRLDVASLNDYENHLTDKVQFLLDSTLGFINIEQNRSFKLLTIASVIGIPPTFVVGLYGMNFKNMPELDWAYGYQWGLLLTLLSIVVPVLWLWRKGWF